MAAGLACRTDSLGRWGSCGDCYMNAGGRIRLASERRCTETVVTTQDRSCRSVLAEALRDAWPAAEWRDVHVVVAVSGGADSVALLRAVLAAKGQIGGRGVIHAAHFNHRQRAEAADADAEWVGRLCAELDVSCHVGAAEQGHPATEENLRIARRDYLTAVAGDVGARWVAHGHHADDQVETVLFRALRGTGLEGLRGIPQRTLVREGLQIIRPLLVLPKADLLAFLREIGQHHREDGTNTSVEPTRNWLRHEVLPALRARMPSTDAALRRLAEHAAEASETLAVLAARALSEAELRIDSARGEVRWQGKSLASCPAALRREAIRRAWRLAGWPEQAMTADHWRRLDGWAHGADADLVGPMLSGGVVAEKHGADCVLARRPSG